MAAFVAKAVVGNKLNAVKGNHLEWSALDSKNLSDYCRKYLGHSVPGRNNEIVIEGFKIWKDLYYKKENMETTRSILIVRCKITTNRSYSYYITRAPETNCVYAVRRNKGEGNKLTIINKHCDFEKELPPKRKRAETFSKTHRSTGQPIAKDKYLLEYEIEHRELLKQEGYNGKRIEWPYAMLHDNLDSYCYQYLAAFAPDRNHMGTTGSCRINKLLYQKLDTNEEIDVTTVRCRPPNTNDHKLYYYMTRAPETNCAYGLVRPGFHFLYSPFVIVFKHCDFEIANGQRTTYRDYNTFVKNVLPKSKVKEEILDTSKTLQLPITDVKEDTLDTSKTFQFFPPC